MAEKPADNVVCIAKASTPSEAHIWQGALENEGIQCHVVGDYLDGGIGNIPGLQAEIWVHEDEAEKARQIIESHQRGEDEDSEEE